MLKKIISAFSAFAIMWGCGMWNIPASEIKGEEYTDFTRTEKVIVTLETPCLADGGNKNDIEYSAKKAEDYIKKFYPDFKKEYSYENLVSGFCGEMPVNVAEKIQKSPYIKTAEKCVNFEKLQTVQTVQSEQNTKSTDSGKQNTKAEKKYTGKGKVIAVIDSEIDTSHKMFSGENLPQPKISQSDVIAVENSGKLHAKADEKAYVSSKLPFVFSYTDSNNPYNVSMADQSGMHGTHVCSIAAGNKVLTDKGMVSGEAPDAQIIFMDVFRYDKNTDMYLSDDSMVIAALEDAVTLGADAINMSFGEDTEVLIGSAYKKACENAVNKGVAIFAAAGNQSENFYSVKNPDNSTILSPSALEGVMSVASCGKNGISAYSSKGVSQSLELKPDIAAEGENVYAAFTGGEYKYLSGTSMSSPEMAGIYIGITESLEKKYPSKSKKEIMALAENILMNSAEIIRDEKNLPVSPRFQGAGRVNTSAAEKCSLVVTGREGRAKVNLYDKLSDALNVSLNFKNLSGKDLSFEKAEIEIITDNSEKSPYGSDNVISGSRKLKFTGNLSELKNVKAGENSVKNVKVSLDKTQLKKIQKEFSNGFFVEGFISLKGEKNGLCCDISIPFMGFYGDWSRVPIFAEDSQTKEETGCNNQLVTNCGSDIIALGENNIDGSVESEENEIYISPNGDGKCDKIGFDMNNLRESVDTSVEILQGSKRVSIFQYKKCINRGYTNSHIFAEDTQKLKEGIEYTAKLNGKINYKGAKSQSIYAKFKVDNTSPVTQYSKIYNENGRKILEIKFTDESRLDGVCILGKGKGGYAGGKTAKNVFGRLDNITNLYSKADLENSEYDFADVIVQGRTADKKSLTIKYDVTFLEDFCVTACDGALNTITVKESNIKSGETKSDNESSYNDDSSQGTAGKVQGNSSESNSQNSGSDNVNNVNNVNNGNNGNNANNNPPTGNTGGEGVAAVMILSVFAAVVILILRKTEK